MIKRSLLPEGIAPRLYRDYIDKKQEALRFLGGEPADLVAARFTGREALVAMLLDYNRSLGCSAQTEEKIKKLADPRAVAVIAGQQAGLCTGPLYTVYKAIAAIKLAEKLEDELSQPVVPVFWLATEDHDFAEADHFWLLDRENKLRRISLELEHRGEPVGLLPLQSRAVDRVLEELAELSLPTEFSAAALDLLRTTAQSSGTAGEWCARLLAHLFFAEGLPLFDPILPEARRMLVPLYEKVVSRQRDVLTALEERESALRSAGYHLQVEREQDASLLMHILGRRTALYRRGGLYTTRDGAASFDEGELIRLINDEPCALSPNVLLRPLAQDTLFPTAVYIAGPGELSYFAQLHPLYAVLDVTAPAVMPRPGLTIVEPRLRRYLERYGVPEAAIFTSFEGYLEQAVRDGTGIDIESIFDRLREEVRLGYAVLNGELERLDGSLPKLAQKNLQRVFGEIAYLEQRARQEARKKNETAVRHFANLEAALRPFGRLQERVLSFFPFYMKYGPDFARKLFSGFPGEEGHYLLYL